MNFPIFLHRVFDFSLKRNWRNTNKLVASTRRAFLWRLLRLWKNTRPPIRRSRVRRMARIHADWSFSTSNRRSIIAFRSKNIRMPKLRPKMWAMPKWTMAAFSVDSIQIGPLANIFLGQPYKVRRWSIGKSASNFPFFDDTNVDFRNLPAKCSLVLSPTWPNRRKSILDSLDRVRKMSDIDNIEPTGTVSRPPLKPRWRQGSFGRVLSYVVDMWRIGLGRFSLMNSWA